jgi:hypothetical protein
MSRMVPPTLADPGCVPDGCWLRAACGTGASGRSVEAEEEVEGEPEAARESGVRCENAGEVTSSSHGAQRNSAGDGHGIEDQSGCL